MQIQQQFQFKNSQYYLYNNNWLADLTANPPTIRYTSGFGAVNDDDGPGSATFNQFLYSSSYSVGSIKCPHYDADQNWFAPKTSPGVVTPNISNTCNILPPDPPDPTDPTIHDRMIAHDSIVTGNFDPETAIMAACDLFDKLDTNETLRTSEEYFSDFYDLYENETLGEQSRVRKAIREIIDGADDYASDIKTNSDLIRNLQLKKSIYDSLLFSGSLSVADSLMLLDSSTFITNTINGIVMQNSSLLHQFNDGRTDNIETAWDLNDEVSPATTLESNEKAINDIYLRVFATDIFELDETDYENLLEVALQCPLSGGHPVFQARAMLASVGDSTSFDDVACEEEELRKAFADNKAGNDVFVFPNPSNNIFKFRYNLPEDENAELVVFDSYSKVIYKQLLSLNSKTISVNFKHFAEGVYYFNIYSSSGIIGNGKLVLIK